MGSGRRVLANVSTHWKRTSSLLKSAATSQIRFTWIALLGPHETLLLHGSLCLFSIFTVGRHKYSNDCVCPNPPVDYRLWCGYGQSTWQSKLIKERLILIHDFRGFNPWSFGSVYAGRPSQWEPMDEGVNRRWGDEGNRPGIILRYASPQGSWTPAPKASSFTPWASDVSIQHSTHRGHFIHEPRHPDCLPFVTSWVVNDQLILMVLGRSSDNISDREELRCGFQRPSG